LIVDAPSRSAEVPGVEGQYLAAGAGRVVKATMRLGKIVFTTAGIRGLAVLTPLYFAFDAAGQQNQS
jgi:hypothetical protein